LVLWALLAAYLIAVKGLHNAIYRSLKVMLFGESDEDEVAQEPVHYEAVRAIVQAPVALPSTGDVDPFILAQINRKIV
jgi:hypothetical protein